LVGDGVDRGPWDDQGVRGEHAAVVVVVADGEDMRSAVEMEVARHGGDHAEGAIDGVEDEKDLAVKAFCEGR
jgi:hypothetical protein